MEQVGDGSVSNAPLDHNLTIRGDLMFSTVFRDPELCKGLIKITTGLKVNSVRPVETQRRIDAGPLARAGIVDVLVMDTDGNAFDIEMQNANMADLPSRARYYGALVDVSILNHSDKFSDLRRRTVVFICSHDPFGLGLKRYTCVTACRESGIEVADGQMSVFLNAEGTHGPSTPALDAFLAYVNDGSMMGNKYVAQVDAAVRAWRNNPVWRRDLMLWELKYKDELARAKDKEKAIGREEGRAEGREETYQELEELVSQLRAQGREDEVFRALSDSQYREKLLAEFGCRK